MAKSQRSEIILTPHFRVLFPNLLAPKKTQRGTDKWSVMMAFPKATDMTALQNAVLGTAQKAWPENWQNILQVRNPIKDGDTIAFTQGANVGQLKTSKYPEFAGCWLVDASSNQAPGLVDQNVQPIMDQNDMYPGCWAHAKVNAYTYDVDGNMGIGIGLQVLQKVKDDDRIGGGAMNAASEFAPIADPSAAVAQPATGYPGMVAPTAPQAAPAAAGANIFG